MCSNITSSSSVTVGWLQMVETAFFTCSGFWILSETPQKFFLPHCILMSWVQIFPLSGGHCHFPSPTEWSTRGRACWTRTRPRARSCLWRSRTASTATPPCWRTTGWVHGNQPLLWPEAQSGLSFDALTLQNKVIFFFLTLDGFVILCFRKADVIVHTSFALYDE